MNETVGKTWRVIRYQNWTEMLSKGRPLWLFEPIHNKSPEVIQMIQKIKA